LLHPKRRNPLHILACIADWTRLRQHQDRHGEDLSCADPSWYNRDTFTSWNDSAVVNRAVGEVFLDFRDRLPKATADHLGQFLVTFCPVLAEEGVFVPPREPDISHSKLYASVSPGEVRRRLELLYDFDLPSFLGQVGEFLQREPDELIAGSRDVAEFLFMWSAALGQAAAKGWGLLVFVD
jgi:hypothetical protein